jgi:hypothetical protein
MKMKKSEKPRFYGQNKLFYEHPTLKPLGSFSHMAACRSSSKNIGKLSLTPKGLNVRTADKPVLVSVT